MAYFGEKRYLYSIVQPFGKPKDVGSRPMTTSIYGVKEVDILACKGIIICGYKIEVLGSTSFSTMGVSEFVSLKMGLLGFISRGSPS